MSIAQNSERQWPLTAVIEVGYADFDAEGVAEDAIDLPLNSVVTGGSVTITEAFDSTTSDSVDVVGGGVSETGVDGQTAARTELTIDGTKNTSAAAVTLEWTGGVADTATQGALRLEVSYVIVGRSNEVEPV